MTPDTPEAIELRREFLAHPKLAHQYLFKHRHPSATPAFHYEMIDDIHGSEPQLIELAFRGSAKSTLLEEAAVIQAALGLHHNRVILGANFARAADRLMAIKHEFETNELIIAVFGYMVGHIWNEDKIVLANNVCIQAYGMEQSFRGVKHLDWRPDACDFDDIEDENNIKTPEARRQLLRKVTAVVMPACDPGARFRMYATPLNPEAAPMVLPRASGWTVKHYPIYSIDPVDGQRRALWPARYPMSWIEAKEEEMRVLGMTQEFSQEYLCVPEDPATKTFTEGMIRNVERVRTWESTYAAYDPARTVKLRSAMTGHAVFSWLGSKLIVWEADGRLLLPDEIVNDIFRVDDEYHPVYIGMEEQGLHEFVMQPIRLASIMRAQPVPMKILPPPRAKLEFIKRTMQPSFKAGQVEFAEGVSAEARAQLLAFPTGRIDVPNALAYAWMLRPGQPVYDAFGSQHAVNEVTMQRSEPAWLVCNATAQYTTGILIQILRGGLYVVADWMREGSPGEQLADIVKAASLVAGRAVQVRVPLRHFVEHDLIGLRAAAARIPIKLAAGGIESIGQEEIRRLLTAMRHELPMLQVCMDARWTLNGLASGYARTIERTGMLSHEVTAGPYKVLIEGLEAFVAGMHNAMSEAKEGIRWSTTPDGRRYMTTQGGAQPLPSKDQWLVRDDNT